MHIQLPLDVLHLIILYIPSTRLRLLCEEDDALKSLIAPILYRYVSIGDFSSVKYGNRTTTKFHNITILELKQLVSGTIDAPIRYLKIEDEYAGEDYLGKFWKIVRDSNEFFLKIPIIDYYGDCDKYLKFLPVQNLRHIHIKLFRLLGFQIDAFPPNITDLTIDVAKIINIPPLPRSLKHLTLSCYGSSNLVFKFPPYLELFSNKAGTFSDELPKSLLKLETDAVFDITLPDGLVELEVQEADSLITFPSGLKKLKLEDIASLAGMTFPCNLEVLDLPYVDVTTLDGIVFPSLLNELRLGGNKLECLGDIMLPNLTLLDITSHGSISSLSQIQFPKLEYLIAAGQPVEDWSKISLPETLKELEMQVMEEPRTLKFPPFLKVLKIHFIDELVKYSDLHLPDTLEELCLEGGVSSIFDWNLPQLRSMRIMDFTGPIKVPESVVDLSLLYKTDMYLMPREQIHIPPNVERLEIPYPLEAYPATVTHLGIYHSEEPSFTLPSNVESVYGGWGELDGSLFTLPNSLNYFYANFERNWINFPSNWDSDNVVSKKHMSCEVYELMRG